MARPAAYFRLAWAGFVLAREGAFSVFDPAILPPMMRTPIALARLIERREVRRTGRVERLNRALNRLGPTYVKFGQTLATRPDIVGVAAAADLAGLQDKMEPFDPALVPEILRQALGEKASELVELSPPIAAASIAQVHKGVLERDGMRRIVAVKILRPDVERRFAADLESFYAGARLAERFLGKSRRLKPVEVVRTIDRSTRLELDLRLEAAAMSEFAENIKADPEFGVPEVHWDHTAQNVLVTSWISAIPIREFDALDVAGLDRKGLARIVLQGFLRHAIRDGFFHADMHPGNLFADPLTGDVIAVDFGIMGRVSRKERRFLADILYGFITRDYSLIARRHFEIGYVPPHQSVDDFTLALRSIGEPLHGRKASEISMAKVLGQLFAVTELFDMQTRPELVLLQKNMVLVEGVARSLDPDLDMWTLAEPVVGDWLRREEGPLGQIESLKERIEGAGEMFSRLPSLVRRAEQALVEHDAERHRRQRVRLPALVNLALGLGVILIVVALWRLLFGF